MNAGKNYAKARAHAQANADRSDSPRWLHEYSGSWWITSTPTADAERIDPTAAKSRHHATKKSRTQLDSEIAEALAKSPRTTATASRVPHTRGKRPTRPAHATKKTGPRDKTSDKITIDQLAKMFGLPDWDKIDVMNQQHYWEMSRGADDEEEAETAARDEVYGQWYDAVESAASKLFEEHGLELQPAGKWHPSTYAKTKAERRPGQLKIVPSNSWSDSADKIRETVNGVGTFHFNDLREFLSSGPYTARQAVLSHLGHIKSYPAVYGGSGAHQLYERAWR
jgi:hypothetical protein